MAEGGEESKPPEFSIAGMGEDEREALLEELLAGLSAARLESVGTKVQQARAGRLEAERRDFETHITPLKAEALRLGFELTLRRRGTGKGGGEKAKPKSQPGTKGRVYPPGTCRNPETGELWVSGRRPPLGISKAVAAGHDPREYLVRSGEHAEEGPQTAGDQRQTEGEQPQEGAGN
jgi:hypothetical protein